MKKQIDRSFVNTNGCYDRTEGHVLEYICICFQTDTYSYPGSAKERAHQLNKSPHESYAYIVDCNSIVQYSPIEEGYRDKFMAGRTALVNNKDDQGGYYYSYADEKNTISIEVLMSAKDSRHHDRDLSKIYMNDRTETNLVWIVKQLLREKPYLKLCRKFDITGADQGIPGWSGADDRHWRKFVDRCLSEQEQNLMEPTLSENKCFRVMEDYSNFKTYKGAYMDFEAAKSDLPKFKNSKIFNERGVEIYPVESCNFHAKILRDTNVYKTNDLESPVMQTLHDVGSIYYFVKQAYYQDELMYCLSGQLGWIKASDLSKDLSFSLYTRPAPQPAQRKRKKHKSAEYIVCSE